MARFTVAVILMAFSSMFLPACEGELYNCSQGYHIVSVNDTMPVRNVVVDATGNITKSSGCQEFLELSAGDLVLKTELTTLCAETVPTCVFDTNDCQYKDIRIILNIERTAIYNMSFKEDNYTVSIAENSKNASALYIGLDGNGVNLVMNNCSNAVESTWESLQLFKLKTENVPFFWSASRNKNSLKSLGDIDFEKQKKYILTLEGTYVDIQGSATTAIIVEIIDEDDQNPIFTIADGTDYQLVIAEGDNSTVNKPFNTTPNLYAYDPDFGINTTVKYKLRTVSPSSGGNLFTIDPDKGTVSVTEVLDYEKQPNYRIIIEAYQVDNPQSRTAQATINVNVVDMDDHKPLFDPDVMDVRLLEHSSIGTRVCNVRAIDTDAGKNGFITYRFQGSAETFEIVKSDNFSAVLIVKDPSKLDREKQANITVLIVPITNDGEPGQNNLTVNIHVDDINDNSPVFNKSEYSFTYVNISAGTSLGQVAATDEDMGDNAALHYEILKGTMNAGDCNVDSPFVLNDTTGDIVMKTNTFPCEGYRFVVQTCDNPDPAFTGRRCSVATVAVAREANGTFDNSLVVNVTESVAINTFVTQLTCTGTGVRYNLSSDTAATPFNVSSNGMLKTTALLDRENTPTYKFLVQADQYGQIKCRFNVSVHVMDANDNAPVFDLDKCIFSLGNTPEKGSKVGTVRAIDADIGENGVVKYSFKTKNGQTYTINGSSGDIELVNPDHVRDIEQLVVIAADNGIPRFEASAVTYVLSGDGSTDSVPLNTPLQTGQITNKQETFARDISEILNTSVVIASVQSYDKSPHRSRIYITSTDKTLQNSTLVRSVFNNYEEIRALFYSARETANDSSARSDLGAPEISLIVMAVVILVGTSIAIVFIHRQFNSHKRYKNLYETLTKDSSMYESQEVNVKMEDESVSVGENESSQAVVTENPLYSGDDTTVATNNNNEVGKTKNEESTSVKEAIDSLDQRLDSEEIERQTVLNSDDHTNGTIESNAEQPDKRKLDGVSDTFVYANVEMNNTDSNGSNGMGNAEPELNTKAQDGGNTEDMLEEPNPDYDRKEVRFNAEVHDADENKMTPLKVKDETHEVGEDEDTNINRDNISIENSDANDENKLENEANDRGYENVTNDPLLSPDTEVEVDEIVSPLQDIVSDHHVQGDFYFATEVSTHF